MVIIFYVDDYLMFSPSKDKIYDVYASLQVDFNIEGDGELNKYPGIDFYQRPYGLTHLRKPYLTQRIINLVPGMDKSSANIIPALNNPLKK